jgi:dihydrodipicolinate synthase/N-acetylneuraminate lyase
MKAGCYTAIATPFANNAVDYEGLEKLADFQIQNGITGILAVGTTGESPVLTWDEHNKVTEKPRASVCALPAPAATIPQNPLRRPGMRPKLEPMPYCW